MNPPPLIIGNLIAGERYIEPQGFTKITNKNNGDTCYIEFKTRKQNANNEIIKNYVCAVIKNSEGEIKYKVKGKYTESLTLINMENGES